MFTTAVGDDRHHQVSNHKDSPKVRLRNIADPSKSLLPAPGKDFPALRSRPQGLFSNYSQFLVKCLSTY